MAIQILSVVCGSLASRAGIQAGEILLRINGEEILDEIDYQALIQASRLRVELQNIQGDTRTIFIRKSFSAPLGLRLDERAVLEPRVCKNHCVFCFVDQMPSGMRPTLYVKDDDWRLSLMMGNFVTLTNVDDREFDRILRRKASPLYISVHATDPETRIKMLRNPSAGNLMDRLKRMKEAGIRFHCQVVLCPGLNDGAILHQTIVDLAGLYPAALSLAIVPIGLTGHRENLYSIRGYTAQEAGEMVRDFELIQAYYLKTLGTRFLFPADEFYSLAGLPVPSEECYEGYPQIENGIGMLRQLAQECEEYYPILQEKRKKLAPLPPRHLLIPTGISALSYIQELVEKYAAQDDLVEVFPVENRFFGPSVTVTGLITGRDLLASLQGKKGDQVLISRAMLRENDDTFLDDLTLAEAEKQAGLPILAVSSRGQDFLEALHGIGHKTTGRQHPENPEKEQPE